MTTRTETEYRYPRSARAMEQTLRARLEAMTPRGRVVQVKLTRSFTADLQRELDALCRAFLACGQLHNWLSRLLEAGRIDTDGGPDGVDLAPLLQGALEGAEAAMELGVEPAESAE